MDILTILGGVSEKNAPDIKIYLSVWPVRKVDES